MNIKELSDEELLQEVSRRKQELENEWKKRRLEKVKLFVEHKEVLLKLLTHDRTSCQNHDNDCYHREHGGAECNKCCLEGLHESDDNIDINLSLSLTKVSK